MQGAIEREQTIARAFSCDEHIAQVVAARARFRVYAARTTILATGDRNANVYLVTHGHARAMALSADGRQVILEDYRSGDLFGEGNLVGTVSATEDVVAQSEVEAGQFTSTVFLGLIESYGAIALAVSRMLTQRLARATRRMVEGATLSAQGRIHAELLRAARLSEDMTIRPTPVLSEFALRVQSTRETCSRTINALEKNGIIRRDADGLRVIAPQRLEDLIY